MKRILFVLLGLVIFQLSVLGQDATPSGASDDMPDVVEYIVTADSANLRSGAGTNFATAGNVKKGDSLLIYDEESETSGWLRIYREGEDDAYIADFLVEKAPTRFYPVAQEPVVSVAERGKTITDVFELPASAYRVDVVVEDNAFILKAIPIEGDCREGSILNMLDFNKNRLTASALLVSSGCSYIFETDNVDGNWTMEIRDLLDEDFLLDSILNLESGSTIASSGRNLTMPTTLEPGVWSVSAVVKDRSFILHAHVLVGDCDDTSVFNELDFDATELEVSSVYRNTGDNNCVIFWESDNVDGEWEIIFEKLN